jgi:LysM repeat protein
MIEKVCPFLGLEDDPDTHTTFPTARNRCYKTRKPSQIALPQQVNYCLSQNYETCNLLQNNNLDATSPQITPGEIKTATIRSFFTNSLFFPITVLVISSLLLFALLVYARMLWGNSFGMNIVISEFNRFVSTDYRIPTPTKIVTRTSTHLPTQLLSSPKNITPVNAIPVIPNIVTTTQTATQFVTNTTTAEQYFVAPTITVTPSLIDINKCPTPQVAISYTVKIGDTLSSISTQFKVSVGKIQLLNCMGESQTLYANTVIFIPVDLTKEAPGYLTSTSTPTLESTNSLMIPSATAGIPNLIVQITPIATSSQPQITTTTIAP